MTVTKPTILLVHGAFGTPAAWDKLAPFLKQAGYPIKRATFPSANPKKPLEVSAKKDIEYVRNQFLLPLIEQERKDVILAVHSFGGIVGGGAAVGLSKADRSAQKLPGGVLGLIYIAGNITHEGQTMFDSVGGQWPPWLKLDNVSTVGHSAYRTCTDCPKAWRRSGCYRSSIRPLVPGLRSLTRK